MSLLRAVVLGRGQLQGLPIGATVISINGEDANIVIGKFARCQAAERQDSNLPVAVQSVPLYLWMAGYDTSQPLELQIKTLDGKLRRCELKSVTFAEVLAFQRKNRQQAERKNYLFRMLPEHNAGLIEFNLCLEDSQAPFEKFLEKTFKELHEQRVSNLIIDLRRNPGGNSSLGDMLMSYLTDKPFRQADLESVKISPMLRALTGIDMELLKKECNDGQKVKDGKVYTFRSPEVKPQSVAWRFKGKVYLLIGRKNYSSAVLLASAMKHYKLATIIGEETGDPTAQYGNILLFDLPNSGLQAGVAAKYFVMAGGSEDGHGVIPHHEVIQTLEDLANNKDPVMEFVLNMIAVRRHVFPAISEPCRSFYSFSIARSFPAMSVRSQVKPRPFRPK